MKLKKYVVKNNLSELYDGIYLYPTDKFASVRIGEDFKKLGLNLNDHSLFSIGFFDTENSDEECCDKVLVPWDSRHLVETNNEVDPKLVQNSINSVV